MMNFHNRHKVQPMSAEVTDNETSFSEDEGQSSRGGLFFTQGF